MFGRHDTQHNDTKAPLLRRSTVLNRPLQLVFPDSTFKHIGLKLRHGKKLNTLMIFPVIFSFKFNYPTSWDTNWRIFYFKNCLFFQVTETATESKPDPDDIDAVGITAEEKGRRAYRQYLKRDDSFITDMFLGQFRSTLK